MSFWQESSTASKIAIAVLVALLLCGLLALGLILAGFILSPAQPDATVTPESGDSATIVVIKGVVLNIPAPAPGAPSITALAYVHVRTGPGTQYQMIGIMEPGQKAEVVGISADSAWWVIKAPEAPNSQGWVSNEFVQAENTDGVPVIQAPNAPQPTPAPPVAITDWEGQYYANRNLEGEPVLVRNDQVINFNWGEGSPAPEVPTDNFSVRWTTNRNLAAGNYRFSLWVDDGARLWIDNSLAIDGWVEGPPRNYVVDVNLTEGSHDLRLEYFEATGSALAVLGIGYNQQFIDWKAEYFNNPNVDGNPVVARNEADINYNWGNASPAPGVQSSNFSIRWSRRAGFEEGNYIFRVNVEGGARLWLDGVMLIDSWTSQGLRTLEADSGKVTQGDHDLRVDYFKATGNGQVQVRWEKASEPGPQGPKAVINGTNRAQVGQTVAFNALNSTTVEGSHLEGFEWDFGDGTTDSGVDVTHVYDIPGAFDVSLIVIDDKGLSNQAFLPIEITESPVTPEPDQPPQPAIDAPDESSVGQAVTFDASRTVASSPIVSFAWDFGDGTTANAIQVEKVYDTPGMYNVILVVTDEEGLQGTTNRQIAITQVAEPTPEPTVSPPEPIINYPTEAKVGEEVVFDGSQSRPGSSPIASYEWDLGDGTRTSGPVVTHAYLQPAVYQVSLTVTGEDGLSNTGGPVQINVSEDAQPEETPTNVPPTSPSAVIKAPESAIMGTPVIFDGSLSQPGSSNIISYEWDFGDGINTGIGPTVVQTYTVMGTYAVTLTVTNEDNMQGQAARQIEITELLAVPQ